MVNAIKLIDVEISKPLQSVGGLQGYQQVQALVRLHGEPVGFVRLPVVNGACPATALRTAIIEQHAWTLMLMLQRRRLAQPLQRDGLTLDELKAQFQTAPDDSLPAYPQVTVAVCTRDRTDNLPACLDALLKLDYPNIEFVIVDNAPSNDRTERLLRERYPQMRYVREPRPGLDWARNRAIVESTSDYIAYTDDDVVVDPSWVRAIMRVFLENPEVMCVTGLTVPYEMETEAQLLFDEYGGFSRGFYRNWYRCDMEAGEDLGYGFGGAGRYGAGANMAYRREIFSRIGCFDPALDVGTVTNGGGDLEMFFRVLAEGCTLVYEPRALVRHCDRRELSKLKTQLTNNGIGLFSFWTRSAQAYPEASKGLKKLGRFWLRWWSMRRWLLSIWKPLKFGREYIGAEFKGSFIGMRRYAQARKRAEEIEASMGPITPEPALERPTPRNLNRRPLNVDANGISMSVLDLTRPLNEWPALSTVAEYKHARIMVMLGDRFAGSIHIHNKHQAISLDTLREAIALQLSTQIMANPEYMKQDRLWVVVQELLGECITLAAGESINAIAQGRLDERVPVSIVIGTYDRPDDLRQTILALKSQDTRRPVEIIVVDNHPESGKTAPVVAEFPGVMLLKESRKGASFARNTGVLAAKGEIVVTTDDDITMPNSWLENLLAPFMRADVSMVTGNFVPPVVDTEAQVSFGAYDGLGRGSTRFEANTEWFESFRKRAVKTWLLGGTGNAAYRASLFRDPRIGLFEELLGAGVPTGTGEDIYFFYKVLKAGGTIIYEPAAFVFHQYRRDKKPLERQIYNYSKGHVVYHMMTFYRDGDWRGLTDIFYHLPKWRLQQIFALMRGRSATPRKLVYLEIRGNLAGPWSLLQAMRHLKKQTRTPMPAQIQAAERGQRSVAGVAGKTKLDAEMH